VHAEVRAQQRSLSGSSPASGAQRIAIAELTRNTSRPPGRSSRAASGIQAYGSHQMLAPYSEIAKSKLASGYGTRSALPCSSSKSMPNSVCSWRAEPS